MSITPQAPSPAPSRRRVLLGSGIAGALAIAGVGWLVWHPGTGRSLELEIGGPFSLVDPDGKTVTDRDLRGRYLLVYFGYTSCPDVCPTTLNAVAGALADLGDAGRRLTPVFITVDPARDTPAVVGNYVSAFSPRLVGLTGTPAQIATVAREYRVYYGKQPGGTATNYVVNHSSLLYLMGPDGGFVAPLRADQDAQGLAADLRHYLA